MFISKIVGFALAVIVAATFATVTHPATPPAESPIAFAGIHLQDCAAAGNRWGDFLCR
ncbi:MAG TPA: hypothetical protein VGI20_05430 [Rhizomicrobium sp.]|jgi:hypothetical protein